MRLGCYRMPLSMLLGVDLGMKSRVIQLGPSDTTPTPFFLGHSAWAPVLRASLEVKPIVGASSLR